MDAKAPSAALLHSRANEISPTCGLYGKYDETNLHAIRDCYWCWDVWRRGDYSTRSSGAFFGEMNLAKWVDWNMQQELGRETGGICWSVMFRQAASSLWFWRNKMQHSEDLDRPPPLFCLNDILYRARLLDLANQKNVNVLSDDLSSKPTQTAGESFLEAQLATDVISFC